MSIFDFDTCNYLRFSDIISSQGELIVYPWSGARRRPSTIFKDL